GLLASIQFDLPGAPSILVALTVLLFAMGAVVAMRRKGPALARRGRDAAARLVIHIRACKAFPPPPPLETSHAPPVRRDRHDRARRVRPCARTSPASHRHRARSGPRLGRAWVSS